LLRGSNASYGSVNRVVFKMSQSTGKENRQRGRFKSHNLASSLGRILDLSSGGVRIFSPRPLKGELNLTIYGHNDRRVRVAVCVAWQKRLGFREYVIGLAFVRLTPELIKDIALIRQIDFSDDSSSNQVSYHPPFRHLQWVLIALGLLLLGASHYKPIQWSDALGIGYGFEALAPLAQRTGVIVGAAITFIGLMVAINNVFADRRHNQKPKDQVTKHTPLIAFQESLNAVLESSLGGVMILETIRSKINNEILDFRIKTINTATVHLLGMSGDLLIGNNLNDCLPCLKREIFYDEVVSVLDSNLPYKALRRLNHNGLWYRFGVAKMGDGLVVTFEDATNEQNNAEKLRHIANHDPLTGLPNRKYFVEMVDAAMMRAQQHPDRKFAVLFLDFDRFKAVNDTLGHEVGDQLLINISKKLNECLRASDAISYTDEKHIAARMGGDEFVVLLEGINGIEDAEPVAKRLVNIFKQPHHLKHNVVESTASIGVVVCTPEDQTADEVIRHADEAMYRAKSSGKAQYVVYDKGMPATVGQAAGPRK